MQRHDYTGIDIDPEYVEFAKNHHPRGRFLAMDARHMDFPADSFDICMFTGVLHHLDNGTAVAIFKDVERVLRKDGHVLISEPVFTKGKLISHFLLSLDRGKFVRDVAGYKSLFANLKIVDEGFFPFSVHRFWSVVLQRHEGPVS